MSVSEDRQQARFTNDQGQVAVQAGQFNAYGDTNVQYHITQSGTFACIPSLEKNTNPDFLLKAQRPRPRVYSTVPFRRDNDFVPRDALTEIHARCAQLAARLALIGLRGVG